MIAERLNADLEAHSPPEPPGGRRMLGHHHRGHNYYRCWPKNNNRGRLDKFTDHPLAVYMREDAILAAVSQVCAEYPFGYRRMELLARSWIRLMIGNGVERRVRLEKRAAELARKQSNVLSQAEGADTDDPFTQGLRERYNALGVEHRLLPPELQARLYELSQLHVRVDYETDHAMIDITLPSDRIDGIAETAAEARGRRKAHRTSRT